MKNIVLALASSLPVFCLVSGSALMVAAGAMISAPAYAQSSSPLAKLQGKKRPLLLFAKSRSDASLNRQESLLREFRPDLEERDMVVLRTTGNDETRSAIGYTSINNGTARRLRETYKPARTGLTMILIGKDGGEKMRWNQLVNPEEIFQIIDAMPMRQNEMKSDGVTN